MKTEATIKPETALPERTAGSQQRVVSLLRRHRFKLIAAGLVAMSYCVPKDDPSGLTMCAAAMCAALIDYELQKQANESSSATRRSGKE